MTSVSRGRPVKSAERPTKVDGVETNVALLLGVEVLQVLLPSALVEPHAGLVEEAY